MFPCQCLSHACPHHNLTMVHVYIHSIQRLQSIQTYKPKKARKAQRETDASKATVLTAFLTMRALLSGVPSGNKETDYMHQIFSTIHALRISAFSNFLVLCYRNDNGAKTRSAVEKSLSHTNG